MRQKRFTICHNGTSHRNNIQWNSPNILQQKNINVTLRSEDCNKASIRKYFNNKALQIKFQKVSIGNIDIVNRKNFSTLASNSTDYNSRRVSHIQLLKKEIEYLDQDLKWGKFPKADCFVGNTENIQPKQAVFNVQSIQNIIADENRSLVIQGFRKTFQKNFYITPINTRPLTSDERRAYKSYSNVRKKSIKKYSFAEQSNKQNKTIHKIETIGPFRRYLNLNRTKRNKSCTVNLHQNNQKIRIQTIE